MRTNYIQCTNLLTCDFSLLLFIFMVLFGLNSSTCGLTSERDEKVIIGYSTSEIRIWGLGNTLLPCSRINNNAARISLACDKIGEDEDFSENNL